MITLEQEKKVKQMSKEDLFQLLDICAEQLGLVSAKEYIEATGVKRSTLYLMDNDKVKYFKISEHKLPLINY